MALRYNRLDGSIEEIRLLRLHSDSKSSPIRCTLFHAPLGNCSEHERGSYLWMGPYGRGELADSLNVPVPLYEALSYTWGDKANMRCIEVNGHQVSVTQNLFQALHRLRNRDTDRVLWVDALCIDQSNSEERSGEVLRMRAIYQRARRVLVWLGEASHDSDLALEFLEKIGGADHDIVRFRKMEERGIMDWNGPGYNPTFLFDKTIQSIDESLSGDFGVDVRKGFLKSLAPIKSDEIGDSIWTAMAHFLLRRPYWKRIWVVQEVVYGQEVMIYCGDKAIDFTTLENLDYNTFLPIDVGSRLHFLLTQSGLPALSSRRRAGRDSNRNLGFEFTNTTLLHYLVDFYDFECTDPRDKIYALLGLPSISRNMPFPKVDYTKPVATVFADATRAIIQYYGNLLILCLPHAARSFDNKHNLPSWVPDWTTRPDAAPLFDFLESKSPYKASGDKLVEGRGLSIDAKECNSRKGVFDFPKSNPASMVIFAETEDLRQIQGSGFNYSGIVNRPEECPWLFGNENERVLTLNGFLLDQIRYVGASIAPEDLGTDTWISIVKEWEFVFLRLCKGLHLMGHMSGNRDDLPTSVACTRFEDDPGMPLEEVYHATILFLNVILRGSFRKVVYQESGTTEEEAALFEEYQIFLGRLSPADATMSHRTNFVPPIGIQLQEKLRGWKFCMTKHRVCPALVPWNTEEEDIVCILFGGPAPFILRRAGQIEDHFERIGTAYVCGVMRGEMIPYYEEGKFTKQAFHLV